MISTRNCEAPVAKGIILNPNYSDAFDAFSQSLFLNLLQIPVIRERQFFLLYKILGEQPKCNEELGPYCVKIYAYSASDVRNNTAV